MLDEGSQAFYRHTKFVGSFPQSVNIEAQVSHERTRMNAAELAEMLSRATHAMPLDQAHLVRAMLPVVEKELNVATERSRVQSSEATISVLKDRLQRNASHRVNLTGHYERSDGSVMKL